MGVSRGRERRRGAWGVDLVHLDMLWFGRQHALYLL